MTRSGRFWPAASSLSLQEQGVVGMSRPPGAIPPPHPAGGVASGVGPNQGSGPPPGYASNQQQAAMMKQMMVMEKRMQMMEQQKQQQMLREQRQQQQQHLLAEQVSLCRGGRWKDSPVKNAEMTCVSAPPLPRCLVAHTNLLSPSSFHLRKCVCFAPARMIHCFRFIPTFVREWGVQTSWTMKEGCDVQEHSESFPRIFKMTYGSPFVNTYKHGDFELHHATGHAVWPFKRLALWNVVFKERILEIQLVSKSLKSHLCCKVPSCF